MFLEEILNFEKYCPPLFFCFYTMRYMYGEHERGMRVRSLKRRASPKIDASRELDISTYCSPLYGGAGWSRFFLYQFQNSQYPRYIKPRN